MRIKSGKTRRKSKKRLFREARGNFLGRRNLLRTVMETLLKAGVYAHAHRRLKKREFRSLWITRVKAACVARGLRYSQFIHGLKLANIALDRKALSELAIHNPEVFDEIVALVKKALPAPAAAA
ncbi:MAG: 50S ribosomal protein L20 [Planctomycetaceae bacterium]|nr:50S ribosomal protein L20 [Planctomycetaceae bacterium]